VDVQVSNGDGPSSLGLADRYTYQGSPPTVTGVGPNAGPTTGGTTVTITGTNFLGAATVTFGPPPPVPPVPALAAQAAAPGQAGNPGHQGPPVNFVVNSATQITAFTPGHAAGVVHVRVVTRDGASAPSGADQFTYH
jgi:hypothetical protein